MEIKYKCLVVDDEKPAHQVIKSHIEQYPELIYCGSAYNGKEALQELVNQEYDIIFLDINMPILTGVELMERMPKRPVTIVTTAYSDYALKSFQHDAVDYLLKPVSFPLFAKAIEKAKLFCDANSQKIQVKNTIRLKVNGEITTIELAAIICIESVGNYLKIYIQENIVPIVVYGSLIEIMDNLDKRFVQVHRSHIVNSEHLIGNNKHNLTLTDDRIIPIGRKYQIMADKLS